MPRSFIPGRDADLLAFARNMADLTAAQPGVYGLSQVQADGLTAKTDAFADLYNLCNNPGTKTPTKVQEKRDAKAALIADIRALVRIIQGYPGTTDAMRRDLNITVRDNTPTPVPVPEEHPLLEVVAVMGRKVKIKLRPLTGEGRAKPDGVVGSTLYYAVGESYPEELEGWVFKGISSQTTFEVTLPPTVAGGAKVWFTSAWFNGKSQTGPSCPPVETRIAGGLSQAA
ncbi:MAG: hypothetical protein ACIAXF_03815 [Phycisphaerales bacterium JB063]